MSTGWERSVGRGCTHETAGGAVFVFGFLVGEDGGEFGLGVVEVGLWRFTVGGTHGEGIGSHKYLMHYTSCRTDS